MVECLRFSRAGLAAPGTMSLRNGELDAMTLMSSAITTVYPPGPDGSGGRYWVLSEKTAELPHVIRYKTDTYAVEFLPVRNDRRG